MLSIARAGLLVSLQICFQSNVQEGLTEPGVVQGDLMLTCTLVE